MQFIAILNAAESSKCAIKIRLLHVLTDSEKWQEKKHLNRYLIFWYFSLTWKFDLQA